MEGRAPDKKNAYFNPNVTWLLVIFVGVALLVVGLTICSDEKNFGDTKATTDSLATAETPDSNKILTENAIDSASIEILDWIPMSAALQHVSGSDKFLMIYFMSDDCPPCRKMENTTFNDEFVQLRMQDLILPVLIDPSSERSFKYAGRMISESKAADIFNIPGYPALLFFDGQTEKYLFVHPGYVSPDTLQQIFNYLEKRIFEDNSTSLMDYLKSQTSD